MNSLKEGLSQDRIHLKKAFKKDRNPLERLFKKDRNPLERPSKKDRLLTPDLRGSWRSGAHLTVPMTVCQELASRLDILSGIYNTLVNSEK